MNPATKINSSTRQPTVRQAHGPEQGRRKGRTMLRVDGEQSRTIKELESLVETISRGKYMWESTFDAITDPVMIVSRDYTIKRANLAAANAAKIDVRTLVGKRCFESLAGRSVPCRGCPLQVTLEER